MTNIELMKKAKELKLKNFIGVFMRDELKNKVPVHQECGILNLNTSKEPGSHWVCWYKDGNKKYYFDSYGLVPPLELVNYLKQPIIRNTSQVQTFSQTNCGQFCLYVLKRLSDGDSFINIETDLYIINGGE